MQKGIMRNHRLLALLLERWNDMHPGFGIDRNIRLLRLWDMLPDVIELPLLQKTLCPVFAEDAAQQKQFNSLFKELTSELHWLETLVEAETILSDAMPATPANETFEATDSPANQLQEGILNEGVVPMYEQDAPDEPPHFTETIPEEAAGFMDEVDTMTPAEVVVPTRKPLVVVMEACDNPPFTWNINPDGDTQVAIETQEGWNRTLIHLRHRELSRNPALDLPASVLATIRQPGMPAIRYKRLTRPPEYLLLVERFSHNDHRASLFEYLFQTLRANRVYVDCFFYTGNLSLCRNNKYPAGLKPSELHYKFPEARVLVLGSGHRFVSARTGLLAEWANTFKLWPTRILLSPVPRSAWGHKESLLQSIFTLLPASIHSLQYIGSGASLAGDGYETLPGFVRTAAEVEPIVLEGPLIRALLEHFDTGMVNWIAACAIWPALHYSLTLRLGRVISGMLGYNLVTAENLLALSRLSWFTAGRIPVEYQDELLDYLKNRFPERHMAVLLDIQRLMEENPPPENSVAWADHQISLAILKVKLDQDPDGNLIRELREVVKRLDGPQKRGEYLLPEKWSDMVDRILGEEDDATPAIGILTEENDALLTEDGDILMGAETAAPVHETATWSMTEAPVWAEQEPEPKPLPKVPPKSEPVFKADGKISGPYMPIITQIDRFSWEFQGLNHDELRQKTAVFRAIINNQLQAIDAEIADLAATVADFGNNRREDFSKKLEALRAKRNSKLENALTDILPEAFAVVVETCRRFFGSPSLLVTATEHDRDLATLPGKNYFHISANNATWKNTWVHDNAEKAWDSLPNHVQLMAGIVMHQGKIAEMAVGEGKHIAMLLAAYLNGLSEEGVFLASPNDALSRQHYQSISPILEFLLLKADHIDRYRPSSEARANAYRSDVTFGAGSAFVYDYLRDNTAALPEEITQQHQHCAILDEVDVLLIDQANTPLVITGPVTKGAEDQEYVELQPGVRQLVEEQTKRAANYLADAKNLFAEGKTGVQEGQAGMALLRAHRAQPRIRALIKFLNETGVPALLQKAENYYAPNAKLLSSVDQKLLFTVDETNKWVELTDYGTAFLSTFYGDLNFFDIPDLAYELVAIDNNPDLDYAGKMEAKEQLSVDYGEKSRRNHVVQQLLKAYTLYEKDTEYIIADNAVVMVDEQTGRAVAGRLFPNGLHQAIEAKENLKVSELTQTYATITQQNYFRKFHKCAGVTPVASTDAKEFSELFQLDVVPIPTKKPVVRRDLGDRLYKSERSKINGLIDEIITLRDQGRPVLVNVISVEYSEILSRLLKMRGIDHNILNAKQEKREAEILAEAGLPGTVTIAANMAALSPEISVEPDALKVGGLAVISTEHFPSKRLDQKLRCLAGIDGTPGSSAFFVSLEDTLLRLHKQESLIKLADSLGLSEEDHIEHPAISKAFVDAQARAEARRTAARKRMLEYDDVLDAQRTAIYARRRKAVSSAQIEEEIQAAFEATASKLVETHRSDGDFETFRLDAIRSMGVDPEMDAARFKSAPLAQVKAFFLQQVADLHEHKSRQVGDRLLPIIKDVYAKEGHRYKRIALPFSDGSTNLNVSANLENAIKTNGSSIMRDIEKVATLALIDDAWKEHLRNLDDLKETAQVASFEQKDPLVTYKIEAYNLYEGLIDHINFHVTAFLSKGALILPDEQQAQQQQQAEALRRAQANRMRNNNPGRTEAQEAALRAAQSLGIDSPVPRVRPIVKENAIGRNDLCPCGSGKKYKNCHGK